MIANRDMALSFILQSEGEKPNVEPGEPGGASKYGVSVLALSDMRKARGLPAATIEDVVSLSEADARAFYLDQFCAPLRFDDLPAGVDYRLLDIAVNLGRTGGVQTLELALGYPGTGKMTDVLVAKANAAEPRTLITALGAAWLAKKHESPKWARYAHGWTNRCNIANSRALAMEAA